MWTPAPRGLKAEYVMPAEGDRPEQRWFCDVFAFDEAGIALVPAVTPSPNGGAPVPLPQLTRAGSAHFVRFYVA